MDLKKQACYRCGAAVTKQQLAVYGLQIEELAARLTEVPEKREEFVEYFTDSKLLCVDCFRGLEYLMAEADENPPTGA